MPIKLTWDDLLIQDLSASDTVKWRSPWAPLLNAKVAPIAMSKFGDWFLRRPDGSTVVLSVIEGTAAVIAATPEEYSSLLNTPEWQEEHLLSFQVYQLHGRGLIPGPGQCYALAPHPRISGWIDIDHATLMQIGAWQHICSQLLLPTPQAP
jgi:hypothetical protein